MICFLLVAILLVGVSPVVMAAGSANIGGPDTVQAGETFTVTFSAGGGILGGSGSLVYDAAVLTLQECTAVIGESWVVTFSGDNFMFYDNSLSSPVDDAAIFTATFLVADSIAEGTRISVAVDNVTLSDGQKDISVETVTYEVSALAAAAPPVQNETEKTAYNQFVATILSLPVLGTIALGCILLCTTVGVTERLSAKKKNA